MKERKERKGSESEIYICKCISVLLCFIADLDAQLFSTHKHTVKSTQHSLWEKQIQENKRNIELVFMWRNKNGGKPTTEFSTHTYSAVRGPLSQNAALNTNKAKEQQKLCISPQQQKTRWIIYQHSASTSYLKTWSGELRHCVKHIVIQKVLKLVLNNLEAPVAPCRPKNWSGSSACEETTSLLWKRLAYSPRHHAHSDLPQLNSFFWRIHVGLHSFIWK